MKNTVEEIKNAMAKEEKCSNRWNVLHQLWDIVAADPEAEKIVSEDLENPDMALDKMVNAVLKHRPDMFEAMKLICEFYGLNCPEEPPIPAEYAGFAKAEPKKTASFDDVDLFDLL